MRSLLFAGLLLFGQIARAEPCPAPPEAPGLASIDSEARIAFLLGTLTRNAQRLNRWSLAWGTTYATLTAAQLAVIPFVDGGTRTDLAAGATAAAVGSASLFLLPLRLTLPAHFDPALLEDPDRCRLLARAEQRFFESAKIDRLSQGWLPHVGNVAVNTALALVLGLGFGRWASAGISAAVGVAIGEANLLTQPHGLAAAEHSYLSGQF